MSLIRCISYNTFRRGKRKLILFTWKWRLHMVLLVNINTSTSSRMKLKYIMKIFFFGDSVKMSLYISLLIQFILYSIKNIYSWKFLTKKTTLSDIRKNINENYELIIILPQKFCALFKSNKEFNFFSLFCSITISLKLFISSARKSNLHKWRWFCWLFFHQFSNNTETENLMKLDFWIEIDIYNIIS